MTLLALVALLHCPRLLDTFFGYALMLRQYGELYAFYYHVLEFARVLSLGGRSLGFSSFWGPTCFLRERTVILSFCLTPPLHAVVSFG